VVEQVGVEGKVMVGSLVVPMGGMVRKKRFKRQEEGMGGGQGRTREKGKAGNVRMKVELAEGAGNSKVRVEETKKRVCHTL